MPRCFIGRFAGSDVPVKIVAFAGSDVPVKIVTFAGSDVPVKCMTTGVVCCSLSELCIFLFSTILWIVEFVSVFYGYTLLQAKLDDHCRSGKPYWDVSKDIGLASLDVILQCVFSSKMNCQVE